MQTPVAISLHKSISRILEQSTISDEWAMTLMSSPDKDIRLQLAKATHLHLPEEAFYLGMNDLNNEVRLEFFKHRYDHPLDLTKLQAYGFHYLGQALSFALASRKDYLPTLEMQQRGESITFKDVRYVYITRKEEWQNMREANALRELTGISSKKHSKKIL